MSVRRGCAWPRRDHTLTSNSFFPSFLTGWNTAAQLTDTGDDVVFSGQDAAQIWTWDAPTGVYKLVTSLVPPGPDAWYSESCAVSSNSAKYGPLVSFGWITFKALQARVTVYQVKTGKLVADYTSLPNAQLQTSGKCSRRLP